MTILPLIILLHFTFPTLSHFLKLSLQNWALGLTFPGSGSYISGTHENTHFKIFFLEQLCQQPWEALGQAGGTLTLGWDRWPVWRGWTGRLLSFRLSWSQLDAGGWNNWRQQSGRMGSPSGRRHRIFCATKKLNPNLKLTQVEWVGLCDLMGSLRFWLPKNILSTHLPRTPSLLIRPAIPTIRITKVLDDKGWSVFPSRSPLKQVSWEWKGGPCVCSF